MSGCVISGTGLFTPKHQVSNAQLVQAFNQYVDNFNQEHAQSIEAGELEAKNILVSILLKVLQALKIVIYSMHRVFSTRR